MWGNKVREEKDMDENTLEKWAFAMQDAYRRSGNREDACRIALGRYPDIPADIRHAMWEAIDAYEGNA